MVQIVLFHCFVEVIKMMCSREGLYRRLESTVSSQLPGKKEIKKEK